MSKFLLIFFTFSLFFVLCKKKNFSPQDTAWAVESLKEVQKICQKILSCSKDLNFSNQSLQKIIQTQLSEKHCLKKYKRSHLFLVSPQQIKIKEDARKCFYYINSLSCLELEKRRFDGFRECKVLKKFQKSKS